MSIRRTIGNVLARVGLEEAVRKYYYLAFGRFITRRASASGIVCTFYCHSQVMADHVYNLDGEREILEAFLRQLKEGDTVWDVGANIGTWSLFAARKVGSRGRVIAFDPLPESTIILKNAKANGIDNITLLPVALGKERGAATLFVGSEEVTAVSSLSPPTNTSSFREEGVSVEIHRADGLAEEHPELRPQAIKIDVEGAEHLVCQGVSDSMWNDVRCIMIEVHPDMMEPHGGTPDALKQLLTDVGFTMIESMERRGQMHWLCVKS